MNALYLIVTVAYAIGVLGLGLLITSLCIPIEDERSQHDGNAVVASAFLLGQGIFANIWLLMAVNGAFSPLAICITFLITAGISYFLLGRKIIVPLKSISNIVTNFITFPWHWKGLITLVILILVALGIKSIVSPPIGDAEAFYMVLPKIIVASHRLIPQQNYYSFTQIGMSGEMHYAALMSLASPHAAKFFVWFTALALIFLLVAINILLGNSKAGKTASLVMVITSTTFTYYVFDGKVDLFGAAFGLAAYYWAFLTKDTPSNVPLFFTGLFTGFAIVAKISNLPVLAPTIAIIIIWNKLANQSLSTKSYLCTTKALLLVGVVTACSMVPHFVKNIVLFGEPFAPFIFLQSAGERWVEQAWFSKEHTKHILLTYPIALIYGLYPMQGGNLSPLILGFAPLVWLLPRVQRYRKVRILQVTVVAMTGVLIWILVRPSIVAPRYILATLLLFIPIAACGAENLFSDSLRQYPMLRRAAFSTMIVAVLAVLPYHGLGIGPVKQLASHIMSGHRDYLPPRNVEIANQLIQPGDRVFFAGYNAYYLSATTLQCMNGRDDLPFNGAYGSLNWIHLYDRGFKYLILDKRTHNGMANTLRVAPCPSWLSVVTVFEDDAAIIYKITAINRERVPSYACKQINPPAWDTVKNRKERS